MSADKRDKRGEKNRQEDNIQVLDRFDRMVRPDKRERWVGERDKDTVEQG